MNIIRNGDFKEDLHAWDIQSGQIYVVEEQTTCSIMLESQSSISQKLSVSPGEMYRILIQMETENRSQIEVEIVDEGNGYNHVKQSLLHVYQDKPSLDYEITTGMHTYMLEIHIRNPHTSPVFLQSIIMESLSTGREHIQEDRSNIYDSDILYKENFKPGSSIWEHAIINQNEGQGETNHKTIGHLSLLSLEPYTQYRMSAQVKSLEPSGAPCMINMAIFNSSTPHTIVEKIDDTEVTTEWQTIECMYRTSQHVVAFDRIVLQGNQRFAFRNIICAQTKKIFHENFMQPSTYWNHLQVDRLHEKEAGYIHNNQHVFISLQHLSFAEKKSYIATTYVSYDAQEIGSMTYYVEFKNSETGVFIRKPCILPVSRQTQSWVKVEIPFVIPKAPWHLSRIGFTNKSDTCLWFTEISIEQDIKLKEMSPSMQTFETYVTPHVEQHKEIETQAVSFHPTEDSKMDSIQAAVVETVPSSSPKEDFLSVSNLWNQYHEEQSMHYQQYIKQDEKVRKIEHYMNQKYTQQLGISSSVKLIDISGLQHMRAISDAYRVDSCFQQLTPACYASIQQETYDAEQYISSFFGVISYLLHQMNPEGIFVFVPQQEENDSVYVEQNQIRIQVYPTMSIQNESLLKKLYETACSDSVDHLQDLDPVYHNVLYGLGLQWYQQMKQMYQEQPHILSHLYETDQWVWKQRFDITFETEESYYATLFQMMYSPLFMYLSFAFYEQFFTQHTENLSITNGMDCIQQSIEKQFHHLQS